MVVLHKCSHSWHCYTLEWDWEGLCSSVPRRKAANKWDNLWEMAQTKKRTEAVFPPSVFPLALLFGPACKHYRCVMKDSGPAIDSLILSRLNTWRWAQKKKKKAAPPRSKMTTSTKRNCVVTFAQQWAPESVALPLTQPAYTTWAQCSIWRQTPITAQA